MVMVRVIVLVMVTKGKRYSIVCWATVKGAPSMKEINDNLSKQYGIPVV